MKKIIVLVYIITSPIIILPLHAEGVLKSKITVYLAKKIITMDTSTPLAKAVAVADGRVVSVGTLESLKPWIKNRQVTIDTSFKDKILMPGFIDPHVHPSLPAILTQFPFIAPDDWSLPTGDFPAAKTNEEYIKQLSEQVETHYQNPNRDVNVPFITWGYHPLWHGDVYRSKLDELFPDKAVMLWHRSFHELIANSAALKLLNISEEEVKGVQSIDWQKGHFWELGARQLVSKMGFIFAPQRYGQGMKNFVTMLHAGGVTSAMDMGTGIFGNAPNEMAMIQKIMNDTNVPTRMVLTPIITDFIARSVSADQALTEVSAWSLQNSDKVYYDNHFKLMIDGAIFSGLAQFAYPGYIDGHNGEWLATQEQLYEYAKVFWNAGYQIHAHTNGDKSAAVLINLIAKLQDQKPRVDHRTTLEHFAYTNTDQIGKLKDLGAAISANPYYQYILSDMYADKWLGEDRARNMVPLGSAAKAGLNIALHSDSPMAPLSPLTLAWAAVNRVTIGGNQNAESEKLSVDQAMRAITIDAAWIMNREQEVGSIRAGKIADFVVLEEDPYMVNPKRLKDIKIWGTVFEGKKFPIH